MKIVVISAFNAGSSYAHAINTTKMAEGFALNGHEVHLITLRGDNNWAYLKKQYGISSDIFWHTVPNKIFNVLNTGDGRRFWHFVKPIVKKISPDFVYTRNYIAPCKTSKMGIPTVAETHAFVGHKAPDFIKMLSCCRQDKFFCSISTISETLREYYMLYGVPEQKISILPDSVDINLFQPPLDIGVSPYGVSKTAKNIVYSGHLYDYKGIPTILKAAQLMPENLFHFIGGRKEDIERHQQWAQGHQMKNIIFHGLKPLSSVPQYLWHADVLLLPPSADHPSAKWTSPVKLGEYCASKRPIIASDIPALRRWLDETQVTFFQPDEPVSLKHAIELCLEDQKNATLKIEKAFELAQSMTYKRRAQKIIDLSDAIMPNISDLDRK